MKTNNGQKTQQLLTPINLAPLVEHTLHTLPDSMELRSDILMGLLALLPLGSPLRKRVTKLLEPLLRHAIAAEHFKA